MTCGPSCPPAGRERVSGHSAARPGPSFCCRSSASARCCNKRSTAWHRVCRPNGRSWSAARRTPHRWRASCPRLPERNVLVEPSPRGSGPAIALATALIARRDPDAIVGSFAADHEVSDLPLFDAALRTAVAAARDGWLVTIGLTPTRPETGYGYIERTRRRRSLLARGFRLSRRALRRKTGCGDRGGVCRLGPLPVEREHVRLASPNPARRGGAAPAGAARRCQPDRPGVGYPRAGTGRRRGLGAPRRVDDRPGRARAGAVASPSFRRGSAGPTSATGTTLAS